MTALLAERMMPRRSESRRSDVSVKVDEEVVRKARIAAEFEAKSLAAYLSDALAPIVDADLARHSRMVLESEKAPEKKQKPGPKGPKG